MKQKITAIIPTLNEEDFIEDAIGSVSFADEIIVVDSFSTDKTVEIAERNKVRVIQRKFDNFSNQKNYAISKAKNDWIYILDADERIPVELRQEILNAMENPNDIVGFNIYRKFYFLKIKISYGGWQADKVIRLFRRDRCEYNGNLVHETINFNGAIATFKSKIDHYSYRGYDHYVNKLNLYASFQAQELYENKKRVNVFLITLKPPFRFFVHYVIRRGFLDGYPGFILATLHAFGVFTRYVKLWLLYKNEK